MMAVAPPRFGRLDLGLCPHVVAVPLAEYARETAPYLKLHRLTHAAETLTRFCTVAALGDVLAASPDRLFSDVVRQQLQDKLDRPTFGAWRELLKVAVERRPRRRGRRRDGLGVLAEFAQRRLLPSLGTGGSPPHDGIIALRNLLAHSGRLTEADERLFLERHPPRFEELLDDAAFLAELQVVARTATGEALLLQGLPAYGESFPPFDLSRLPPGTEPPRPDRLLLLTDGRAVDLFPLHAYADVFHFVDKRPGAGSTAQRNGGPDPRSCFERIPEASPAAQLYFRLGARDYLEYTAFSPYAAHSQEGLVALERFKQVFRLDDWRRQAEARAALHEFDFSPWYRDLLALFVGRDTQVSKVNDWIKDTSSGLCWLHGHPGVGKSAFVARLSRDYFTDAREVCKIVHVFRAADARCSRSKFLENALSKLAVFFGLTESIEADPRKRIDQFTRALTKVSREEAAKPVGLRRRILFLLDGLDEVCQHERAFSDLIFDHILPGVVWVCAGREDFGLGERFRQARAHLPFGEAGLPGLRDRDIRMVLDHECGPQIYDLIARDRPDTPPGENANPFLDALVQRSGGLPLYLRLLVQDLREGRFSFKEGAEKHLPQGLTGYFEQVLERLHVSDVASVLTPVFGLLAVARAPLTFETIEWLLAEDRVLRQGGEPLLRRVLEFGHQMLRRVELLEAPEQGEPGEPVRDLGYTLDHESFREHLLQSATVSANIGAAVADFCRCALRWRDCRELLFPYRHFLRFGPAHLASAGRPHELGQVLTDLDFVQAKCAAGMTYELQSDYATSLDALPEGRAGPDGERAAWEEIERFARELARLASPGSGSVALSRPPATASLRREIRRIEQSAPGSVDPAGEPTLEHALRLFAAFVSRHSHFLARCAGETIPTARNEAVGGPLVARAEASAGHLTKLWVARDPRPAGPPAQPLRLRTLQGHTGPVRGVALRGDGRIAVSASHDGTLRVWEPLSGQCLRVLEGHSAPVNGVAVTADGSMAVSASDDRTVRVWDLHSGALRAVLEGHTERVNAVALGSDGRTVASSSFDGTVRVWDLASGRTEHVLEGHHKDVAAVVLAADGRLAVSAGFDRAVRFWALPGGLEVDALEGAASAPVSLALSLDAQTIVTSSAESVVLVCDCAAGRYQGLLEGHEDDVEAVAITPDGGLAISASLDQSLRVWDLATTECLRVIAGGAGWLKCVALRADGRLAVSGGGDHTLQVWDLLGQRPAEPLPGHDGAVQGVALSPGGRMAISVSGDTTLGIWDARSGRRTHTLRGHDDVVFALSLDAEGRLAASGSRDGSARVWDLTSMRCVQVLDHGEHFPTAVVLTPGGQQLVTGSGDATIRIWDVASGRVIGGLSGHTGWILTVAVTPDARTLISAAADRTVRVWDLVSGRCLHALEGPSGTIAAIAVSSDSKTVFAGGSDAVLYVWDLDTGRLRQALSGHALQLHGVALSPDDGGLALTASSDQTVRVWDVVSGRCLASYFAGTSVLAISGLSPEGRFVAGTQDGQMHFLELRNLSAIPSARPWTVA